MAEYVPGANYLEYLQTKSFAKDIQWSIAEANLNLAATRDAIEKQGFRIERSVSEGFGKIGDTLVEGFVRLHLDLRMIESSIDKLGAAFDWGFASLEARLGSLGDSLDELVRLARTPEQTWAYEQFDIARGAFERELFPEALEHIEFAINGNSRHTGHKLEHRFHQLLGIIRRGSYRNNSAEIVDLKKAEQAYLSAARYAGNDHKNDAAFSLCAAGWVAFCQNELPRALEHTMLALSHQALPEANFQLAKIHLHRRDIDLGLDALSHAIEADALYSVRCFGSDIFLQHEKAIRNLVDRLRNEKLEECRKTFYPIKIAFTATDLEKEKLDQI